MRAGAITKADQEFVETWENISVATNVILRLDARGMDRQEVITGRRKFFITTEERLITSDRIVDPAYDPFLNGMFRPVVVPDTVTIQSNPNALSDDEIRSVFVSSDVAWTEWMNVLNSPDTLARMLDLAENSTIALARYRQIEARLNEVKPKTQIVQKDREQFESMSGTQGGGRRPSAAR